MRFPCVILAEFVLATLTFGPMAAASEPRPTTRPPRDAVAGEAPPSPRSLVDARAEFVRRYPGLQARQPTMTAALHAVDVLIDAAVDEPDRPLKWLMLAEARRLAVAAGHAEGLDRAIVLASATYEFDALAEELRALEEIPIRMLAPQRAAAFASIAEKVAARADADGRAELAISCQSLAVRGWQRAGAHDAARRATIRHGELVSGR